MGNFEEPQYTLIDKASEKNIEIREYKDALIAKVTVNGDRSKAANKGFRSLAKYIFGGNQQETDIAMTAPVLQQPVGDDAWDVLFFMPSEFDTRTLPAPNQDIVNIETLSARKVAAISFSGRWTKKNLNKHKYKLEAYLAKNDIKYEEPAIYAFYNDPFTPWFLRHNEVMFILN